MLQWNDESNELTFGCSVKELDPYSQPQTEKRMTKLNANLPTQCSRIRLLQLQTLPRRGCF